MWPSMSAQYHLRKKKKNLVEAGYIYANNSSSIITVPLPKIGYMPQYEKCVP